MAETDLKEKNEEASGIPMKSKTLIDLILDGTGSLIKKPTGRTHLVPFWYSAAVICLLLLLVGPVISVLLGEYTPIRREMIPIEVLGCILAYASLVIFKLFIDSVFARLHKHILPAITAQANQDDLSRWLGYLCNTRLHLAFTLVYGLALGSYAAIALSLAKKGFIGYGPSATCCLVGLIWGIPMYFLLVFLLLPFRLSQYDYRLFKTDPGSSEVIAHLSDLLRGLVILYAVVAAGSMVFLSYAKLLQSGAMISISIIVAWIPITLLFIASQYALAKIIRRAKWNAINEVQAQIEQIQAEENLTEKESMEKFNRLMDYHERIKGTKNSTLDLRAGLTFLNSLLLPVAGFLLGNLDKLKNISDILNSP